MTGQLVARNEYLGIQENQVISYSLPELSTGQYLLTGLVNGYSFSRLLQIQ